MARELLQEVKDFTYDYVKRYPYTTSAPIVSLSYMRGWGDGLRHMELRALVIKEMDRAKKRIKEE